MLWPIVGGAVMVTGVLCGCALLRSDGQLRRAQGWLESGTRSGMTAETASTGWLIRFGLAFGLTQLPAETLRLRQLSLGALNSWAAILGVRARWLEPGHAWNAPQAQPPDRRACPYLPSLWSRLLEPTLSSSRLRSPR